MPHEDGLILVENLGNQAKLVPFDVEHRVRPIFYRNAIGMRIGLPDLPLLKHRLKIVELPTG
jgi:hypothetical protein